MIYIYKKQLSTAQNYICVTLFFKIKNKKAEYLWKFKNSLPCLKLKFYSL